MVVTANNISADRNITVESVSDGIVNLSEGIATETNVPLTFSTSGVTVSSVTDANTLVSSVNMTGIKDNISLQFGVGGDTDVIASVSGGTVVQSGDNVIIAGTFHVMRFPNDNVTVYLDATELITIT